MNTTDFQIKHNKVDLNYFYFGTQCFWLFIHFLRSTTETKVIFCSVFIWKLVVMYFSLFSMILGRLMLIK